MTSLTDYYDQLCAHDWTHAMTEDNSVYKRGEKEEYRLMLIRNESAEHRILFDKMKEYAWGRGDRPAKPMEKTFRTGESNEGL